MNRKTTSIKIEPELWKEVKLHCVRQSIDISEYLERLLRKDLKR